MELKEIMVDGHVRLFAKYRTHRVKGKSRYYIYHTFEAEFDGKRYEATSSKDQAQAKSMVIEKLRVAIRDRSNGSLAKATPTRDEMGVLTEHALVSEWAELWCQELVKRAEAGDGSRNHAGRSRSMWTDHLVDAPIDDVDPRSLGRLPLNEVKPAHVTFAIRTQGKRIHFKKGKDKPSTYSGSQRRQWRAFVSGMFTYAISKGRSVTNPCGRHNAIRAEAKVAKDILSKEDIKTLWESVKGNPRDMLIVALGLVFMRPGEIAGLSWSDFGPDKFVVRCQAQAGKKEDEGTEGSVKTKRGAIRMVVDRAKTEKSTGRHVVITPFLREAITAAKKAGLLRRRHVITDDDGKMVTSGWLSAYVPKLITAANLRRRNAYILKHTGCSHFLIDGGPITELEAWSGVAAATLWRYYSHYVPAASAERMATWNLTAGI